MHPFIEQLRATLRLHFRNRMAILYSYLFPTIFLIAFWVLYRHERVPLARHMGELLTVTALGGACFGLPTTMVSERERGVWRRYRLAPVSTGTLLASTVIARYVLLVLAGLLQVALAMGVGMPVPNDPVGLLLAFTFVAFALLGLGLVIASLADNVPAVQALGQCVFLPMLIIGGVAVQLASLPDWAQHLSAFFPGRYAVDAMQTTVTGQGIRTAGFSLLALVLIGAAGFLAGVKMFRWDAQERFAARSGKGWAAAALAGWLAVGLLAEAGGHVKPRGLAPRTPPPASTAVPDPAPAPAAPQPAPSASARADTERADPPPPSLPPGERSGRTPATEAPGGAAGKLKAGADEPPAKPAGPERPAEAEERRGAAEAPGSTPPPPPSTASPAQPPPSTPKENTGPPPEPASWQEITPAHIDQVVFERLPADAGVVSPIAPPDEPLDPDLEAELEEVRARLATWGPARVAEPVQRVRNVLYVAAVPDVFQLPLERYLPHVVFERLQEDVPKEDLVKILFWIATHPGGGDDSAVDDLRSAGLQVNGPSDIEQARERVMLYALKLLGRLVGRIGG